MKPRPLMAACVLAVALTSCSKSPMPQNSKVSYVPQSAQFGGESNISLHRSPSGEGLQFLRAEILPGRGWNIFQIHVLLPGKGEIPMLDSPGLLEAAKLMSDGGPSDRSGNQSFAGGGAILVPFANRITGKLINDGKDEVANLGGGVTTTLAANWGGKKPGAQQYAMHGLILSSKVTPGAVSDTSAEGSLDAGDFGGHWPSKTELHFKSSLAENSFDLEVTARNSGSQDLPLGIGWHPYFRIPSGQREQARLRLPATERAPANNYDEVLPTGKVEKVAGTPFDFTAEGGRALGSLFMDDTFEGLQRDGNKWSAEVIDPASNYGVRIVAETPEIKAIQVYAPPTKQFIVVEPQFNLADPFSPVWKGHPTGMVTLKPGQSVVYRVHLELFQPQAK